VNKDEYILAGADCQCSAVYRLLVGVWIFLGLAWLAGVISAVQEKLKSIATSIESRLSETLSSNAKCEVCVMKFPLFPVFLL